MITSIVEYLIRKRNPAFHFDQDFHGRDLVAFAWPVAVKLLRGQLLWFRGCNPKFMMKSAGVQLSYLHRIKWGRFLKLGKHVELSALGKNGISLGDNVSIGDFGKIVVSTTPGDMGAFIQIGNNVGIGEFCYLGGAGGLHIGDHTIIGQYLSCHPENHNFEATDTLIRLQGVSRKGIRIGSNCWIGSKVIFLDGAVVGDGCVVAAGAVVNGNFPKNSVIGGVPAKVLKTRIAPSLEYYANAT